ncbi:MAG: hypothetical protein GX075_07375 [Firmicutes bacterium]|nr:hypothetical protein [Bacillota bacterium]
MKYNPDKHHRRSIRLKGYDYSLIGAYFITICTKNRQCLFGEIIDDTMVLNDAGRVADNCWNNIPAHFPHVELDEWIIMPNHIHGIILITMHLNRDVVVGAKNFSPLPRPDIPDISDIRDIHDNHPRPRGTSKTIGSIVRGFKIGVTKWMRHNTDVYHVWHRNYWEHIIRNENELNKIRNYIRNNPLNWRNDKLNAH